MGAVYRSRSRLAQLVDENSEEGHLLIRAAEVMERNAEWAAAVARMVPRVAHHGDLSKENALVDGVNVRFVDFEHAQVVYLGDALWTLGEDWGSLPRHEMVDVALRSIVNGYFGSNVERDVYSNAIMAWHTSRLRRLLEVAARVVASRGVACASVTSHLAGIKWHADTIAVASR